MPWSGCQVQLRAHARVAFASQAIGSMNYPLTMLFHGCRACMKAIKSTRLSICDESVELRSEATQAPAGMLPGHWQGRAAWQGRLEGRCTR
jgi:hypothetical protein